jgi:4-amino-4-deoxy-L-arabinose transferase-like glycosyltransferase
LQLGALVVLGAITVERFHVWAPVDERAHYAYVQSVAEEHRLPTLTDLVSPEVQAITDDTWPRPSPTDPATIGLAGRSYEAFQPPLYYVVAGPAFVLVRDHLRKVTALRAFDLVLLAIAIWLLWRLSRRVAGDARLLAFSAALTVVLWPGVLVRAVTVSSASLELVLATALLLVAWRLLQRPARGTLVLSGALLGACLLTKSTLVYLAPVALLAAIVDWRRRRDVAGGVTAVAVPALMLAPWLAFNREHYDALTASSAARAQQQSLVNPLGVDFGVGDALQRTVRMLDAVLPAEWVGQLDVLWVRVVAVVLFAALFGVAVVLAVAPPRDWSRRALWFFGLPLLTGYLMLVITLLSANWPSFNLRYLYPVLPSFAIAVASAFATRGTRAAWCALAACSVLLAVLWIDMAGAFYFTDVGNALGI